MIMQVWDFLQVLLLHCLLFIFNVWLLFVLLHQFRAASAAPYCCNSSLFLAGSYDTQQLNDFKHQLSMKVNHTKPKPKHPSNWTDQDLNDIKQILINMKRLLNELQASQMHSGVHLNDIKQFNCMKCFVQKPNPTLVWYTTCEVETRANAWLISSNPVEKWATFEGCQVSPKKTKANTFKMNVFGLGNNVLGSLFDQKLSHLSIKCESWKWSV